MSPIVKCLAMALALLAVGGCAYRNTLVLENGEKVDSLYYHESRMPDEVMMEMWIDFDARRFRFKCGLHDAMGWGSSRFDGLRLDLSLEGREWQRLVKHVQRANVEAWPRIKEGQPALPANWIIWRKPERNIILRWCSAQVSMTEWNWNALYAR